MLEEVGHCLIDKLIGYRLFRLVLIACLCGKAGRNQNQTGFHVLKFQLGLIFQILVVLPQVGVDLRDERLFYRLIRRTAVFQPAGIVIVFQTLYLVGKCQCHAQLYFISRLIFTVTALSLAAPVLNGSQRIFPGDFLYIVSNAVFIEVLLFCKGAVLFFLSVEKQQIRVYNCLSAERVAKIVIGNLDLCKYVQVGQPVCPCSGLFFLCRFFLQTAYIDAFFKVQIILITVTKNFYVHIGRRKLCCTQSQTVQAQ